MNVNRDIAGRFVGLLAGIGILASGWAQAPDPAVPAPMIERNEAQKVSDHVYVILDKNRSFVPNIGIIVGDRATLVIDTGLGLPNGEIVLEEAKKLSTNEELYVVSTHYHSEHDLGAGAFPATATMIRSRDQQQDLDEFRLSHAERFSSMSATMAGLLVGADYRQADVYFEDEYSLDLGGVTVQMYAVGPAHTRGDTVFLVEQDSVLFAGDVAMRRYPRLASPTSGVRVWLEALQVIASLPVELVVPSHGPMGDASVIEKNAEFFSLLQSRSAELKARGRSEDEVAELLATELAPSFSDWDSEGIGRINPAARVAFAEAR